MKSVKSFVLVALDHGTQFWVFVLKPLQELTVNSVQALQ